MNQLTLVLFVRLTIHVLSVPFELPKNGPQPLIVQKENGGLYLMVPKQEEGPVVSPTIGRVKSLIISQPVSKSIPHVLDIKRT